MLLDLKIIINEISLPKMTRAAFGKVDMMFLG